MKKIYIIIYILLDIKPFWVQYWSNRFNIFYTMCLRNKFFTKCCNFYLFLTLNTPQKRLILPFPPRPLFNAIKKFHWNTVKAIRPLKNANFQAKHKGNSSKDQKTRSFLTESKKQRVPRDHACNVVWIIFLKKQFIFQKEIFTTFPQ